LDKNLNKIALKSGSGYMLANILIRSTALISAPIFTRLLSTSDYGIASNFFAWVAIISVIIGLGLPYSIGNASIDFKKDLRKYIASIQVLGSIVALIFLIFGFFFNQQLANIMSLDSELVLIIFIYLLFYPSVIFAQEKYKYQLLYKENIIIAILNSLGAIFFCVILILYVFDDQRYLGRVIGLILPMFLIGIYYYFKTLKEVRFFNIKKYWSYALKISLPMIPHSLAMIVLTQIDRIMIINFTGNSNAGLYSFGFSYAVLMLILSNAILQAYNPWLYLTYEKNDFPPIKKSNEIITFSLCVITIIIITIGPEMLFMLGTTEFMDARWIITPIALGALFQFVYNNYSSLELYHKKTKIIAIGTILTAIVNIGLNYTFIPLYGYYAAGYTTFISYLLLAFFHLYAHRKICNRIVFNDRFIWIATLSTSILAIIMTLLYPYTYIRYMVLIILLLFLISIKKKEILYVYKFIKTKKL
tara:strand:- start:6429 stop:7850 length:1422 start_codon:yes stop_codon:yes gene_type:complete